MVPSHWPAQSPDLNPIENLWDQIKTMVQEQDPTSVKELWTAINSAWEGFPSDRLNNLIVIDSACLAGVQLSSGPEEGLLNIKTFLLYLFCSFGIILSSAPRVIRKKDTIIEI